MAEVAALPAASVILLRDDPFEVLMLRRHEKASFVPLEMIFPTMKNLEAIQPFTSSAALIASRHGADIPAIQPIIVDRKIVLP